jgi:nickel-dependent lactate racemase
MKLEIPYGRGDRISLEAPSGARVIEPRRGGGDEDLLLRRACQDLLRENGRRFFQGPVLFLVNDGTRPTPTARALEALEREVGPLRGEFLVATGAHRPPRDQELEFIFGSRTAEWRDRIHIHDARSEGMVEVGETRRGTRVAYNRRFVEAERVLVIGSVEPHYHAGYTGGKKAIFPGVASYSSIEENHRLALERGSRILGLCGNPVREDLEEAAGLVEGKEIRSLLLVQDASGRIVGAFGGGLESSFPKAVTLAERIYTVPIQRKAEIVVSVAPFPMDRDLYQSQKALYNGSLALREGGILILVSSCWGGIGNRNFYSLLARHATPEAVLEEVEREYRLGYQTSASLARMALRHSLWAVSDLDDDILKGAFLIPHSSLPAALEEALRRQGGGAEVLFLPKGSVTVPQPQ